MTALEARGLACLRGDRLLFEDIGLAVPAGGALLVTGPNGVGKSSLLRMLAGLLKPAAGTIRAEGRIALAAEQAALDADATLAGALGFWAGLDDARERLGAALAALGLEALGDVPVRYLSTGQRKRAVLARVIASGADIWLLDEPGNGLDTAALERLAEAMAAHRARDGIIVAASHQPLGLADAGALPL